MKQLFVFFFLLTLPFLTCASEIISEKTYKISSYYGGKKSLSVRNSSLEDKAEIITWTDTDVNSQRWKISKTKENFYFLTNAYSEKVLIESSRRPKPGDKMIQDINDSTLFCQWELVPVDETAFPDTYYLRFALKSSDSYLYLELSDDINGSLAKLQLKSNTNDSIRQMWRVQEVDNIPNKVTDALRKEIMKGWKDYYYKSATVGHVLGSGGWWGDAEMIEVVLDAYETTGDPAYKEMFSELYKNFTQQGRNGTSWSYNEYNDDIAWMVIAAARAYLMFDDGRYLNHARNNFDNMYARALLPSGMLRWKESPKNNQGTNSCINGPAGVAACYLALATGEENYYEIAKNLYALQRRYLYEPSTGKVFDSGSWNNEVFSINNRWVSTYNQGTFLGAALMLYNHYGDAQYENDAHKIVEWTRKDLCNARGIIKVCGSGNDLQGFKGILMRYLRRYVVDLAVPESVEWLQKNVLHAFNNRNSKGIIWTAWWEKSTEDFIFSDGYNYRNQPFGASTAVSAAFNAPLDKNLIVKDAFSTIEAEHFDYLKGVFVESGSDNTVVIGNTANNYYTAYNNVEFGNLSAVQVSFRVMGGAADGMVEMRLGSPTGQLIATVTALANPSGTWTTVSCPIDMLNGRHNIYLVYKGTGFKLDSFHFSNSETGIQNTSSLMDVRVYPNPVVSNLYVSSPDNGYLTIYNSSGKHIYSKNILSGITNLNVESFNPELYFVNLQTKTGQSSAKFLKE